MSSGWDTEKSASSRDPSSSNDFARSYCVTLRFGYRVLAMDGRRLGSVRCRASFRWTSAGTNLYVTFCGPVPVWYGSIINKLESRTRKWRANKTLRIAELQLTAPSRNHFIEGIGEN
eukprot:scaffold2595_cov158-Amphora_coffeaeformis.AAC.2